MIRDHWKEEWKTIVFDDKISKNEKFKISNYGRIKTCINQEEVLVKEKFINGYQSLPVKQAVNGKQTSRYVHRLVAEHFLEKPKDGYCVVHLNYDKKDNKIQNLKWVNKSDKIKHQHANPIYDNNPRRTYSKLTETKVKLIKRKLNDPNRRTRLKMIAKQFGISEMQLHRIKTGENWGSVTEY